MSATALSIFLLLSIVLMVESCMKMDRAHTTHGFPTNDNDQHSQDGNNQKKSSGPVPPHPFKRSVNSLETTKLNDFVTIKIQELFNDFDSNSDGLVTVTEWTSFDGYSDGLVTVTESTRRTDGVTEFARILRNFDTNADNALSFEEFLAATSS